MKYPKFTKANLHRIKTGFIEKVREEQGAGAFVYKKRKRVAAVLLASALAVSLGFGAAAAANIIDMSEVYRSFLGEGSENAGFNINTSDLQNGIQVSLLSAVADGNNGYLFLTLQDMEGDRLNSNLGWDIFQFETHGWFKGGVGNGRFDILGYDESSKTLSAVMQIHSSKGIKLHDKLTLTMNGFETEFERSQDNETGLDLYSLLTEQSAPQTTTEYAGEISSWTAPIGTDMDGEDANGTPLLKKNGLNIAIDGINSVIISNMGFVDGKLHIQYQHTGNWRDYNNSYIKLLGKDGAELPSVTSISVYEPGPQGKVYEEFVYNIASPEEVKDIAVLADVSTSAEHVTGPWTLDFEIDSQTEHKEFRLDSIAEQSATNVVIDASSISTVISFDAELRKFISADDFGVNTEAMEKIKVTQINGESENYLKLTDGGTVKLELNGGTLDYEANAGDFTFFHRFYDLSTLESIVLNGVEYPLG